MLVDWLFHPDYTKKEKLLWVLFSLGMADRNHLAQALNCSVYNVDRIIKEWNRKQSATDRTILVRRPARDQPRMYYLGPRGWAQVMEWLEEDRRYNGKGKRIAGHYRGINEIFLRLVSGIGYEQIRERLTWYSSYEAWEILLYPWSLANAERWKDPEVRKEEEQLITRPDARVVIEDQAFWVEFDNGTKRERPIKDQFRRYIQSLAYLPEYVGVHDPVVWVTTTEKRRKDLKRWWSIIKREPEYENLERIPDMYFFIEGEETKFLFQESIQKTG